MIRTPKANRKVISQTKRTGKGRENNREWKKKKQESRRGGVTEAECKQDMQRKTHQNKYQTRDLHFEIADET